MGLIKEPVNVDFYFVGKQMTDEDQQRVSDYIREKKASKKTAAPKNKTYEVLKTS